MAEEVTYYGLSMTTAAARSPAELSVEGRAGHPVPKRRLAG